jgi:GNAT superfamily N-acetyltransferase
MTQLDVQPATIREIKASDDTALREIARLHVAQLSPGALAEMGEGFVQEVGYRLLIRSGALQVAALMSDRHVRGFIAFADRAGEYQGQAFRYPLRVMLTTLRALLQRPARLGAVFAMLQDMRTPLPKLGTDAGSMAEIAAIAVDPSYLRSSSPAGSRHPGDLLLDYAIGVLHNKGCRRLCARINADRRPALLLYARRGADHLDYLRRGEPMVQVMLKV